MGMKRPIHAETRSETIRAWLFESLVYDAGSDAFENAFTVSF